MLTLHKFRLGLACNSSSTHSVIFLKEGVNLQDSDVDQWEFGWDYFTAANKNNKQNYLAITLYDALRQSLPVTHSLSILESWMGIKADRSKMDDGYSYIDHQSEITLPKEYNTNVPDKQFFEELQTLILGDKVAILGGNDNDESEHHYIGSAEKIIDLPVDMRSKLVCRKDPVANYWTLFCSENGAKYRFSLGNDKPNPEKAYAPELVDVKITDFCPFNCPYCYQGSTIDGVHAKTSDIFSLIDRLADHKVFEMAIGGGEPTLHPEFIDILMQARRAGIVPNFTTKNLAWMKNPEFRDEVLKYAGNFAVSVENDNEIEQLALLLKTNRINLDRVTLQVVMGLHNKWGFSSLIKEAKKHRFNITLLGYKTTGRGSSVQHKNYDWWIDELIKQKHYRIGIDTVLAQQYSKELAAANVPKHLVEYKEGKFSMYVDAVAKKAGPSSYCDPSEMVDWDLSMLKVWNEDEREIDLPEIFKEF